MQNSPEQTTAIQTVVDAVTAVHRRNEPPVHVCIEAVAGAGKTHTLLELTDAVYAVHPNARILLLAFNRAMAAELRQRAAQRRPDVACVDASTALRRRCGDGEPRPLIVISTVHAFGYHLLASAATPCPSTPRAKRRRRCYDLGLRMDRGDDEDALSDNSLSSVSSMSSSSSVSSRSSPPVVPPRVDPEKMLDIWQRLTAGATADQGLAQRRRRWEDTRTAVDRWRQFAHPVVVADDDPRVVHPRPLVEAMVAAMTADQQRLDHEEMLYHCLHYEHRVPASQAFDLVLVDEGQDLNKLQHVFLQHCVVGPRTVVCAVGDPCQAVYAFRGALPDSLERLSDRFRMQRLRLTQCFRCSRRVVATVQRINRAIVAGDAPTLTEGGVRVVTLAPGELHQALWRLAVGHRSTLFLARDNRTLLWLLRDIWRMHSVVAATTGSHHGLPMDLRWISPMVADALRQAQQRGWAALTQPDSPACHLAGYLAHLRGEDDGVLRNTDRTLLHILQMAVELEGGQTMVARSRWLAFLRRCLCGRGTTGDDEEDDDLMPLPPADGDPYRTPTTTDNDDDCTVLSDGDAGGPSMPSATDGSVTLGTVHAVKGQEFHHVVVWEWNLFGRNNNNNSNTTNNGKQTPSQEHNLLYIALTRSMDQLTLLLNERTKNVSSPFLPVDALADAG